MDCKKVGLLIKQKRLKKDMTQHISDILSGEEHAMQGLNITDKIIIILCLLLPGTIISVSLMLSCFRTEYILIGSIFILIVYLLFLKKENNLATLYFIYYIFTIYNSLYKTNIRHHLFQITNRSKYRSFFFNH